MSEHKANPFPTCPNCGEDLKLKEKHFKFPGTEIFKQIYTEVWVCDDCELKARKAEEKCEHGVQRAGCYYCTSTEDF